MVANWEATLFSSYFRVGGDTPATAKAQEPGRDLRLENLRRKRLGENQRATEDSRDRNRLALQQLEHNGSAAEPPPMRLTSTTPQSSERSRAAQLAAVSESGSRKLRVISTAPGAAARSTAARNRR